MMNKMIPILLFLMSITINGYCLPTAKLTLRVVDEQGLPVEGAIAYINFTKPNYSGIGVADMLKNGVTGKDGLYVARNVTMNSVSLSAEKKGYYHSSVQYEFHSSSKLQNRWEPWNPTIEVVLKKKRNPIPMYIKYIEAAKVPVSNSTVGYDFEKGDWVLPYGIGVINDILFRCNNEYEDFTNAEASCEISFSNPKDGFQELVFDKKNQSYQRWPFEAPIDGYNIKKITKWMSVHLPGEGYKSNYKENTNYLFMVRTVVDENGNITKANYGKLKGDIRVYKEGEVSFFYYFNNDGTRNLEEDLDINLLKKH